MRLNGTDTRKLVKRVTLVISVTPSQNNNGIQTASLAANRPEGVGRLLMSQWDIAATTASSLSEMMSNFDSKHCCIERSRSSRLISMQCICFSMVTRRKADAGQTGVGQPDGA